MADSPEPQNPNVQGKQHAETQLQLLPFLKKFFKGCGCMVGVWVFGRVNLSIAWVIIPMFAYMIGQEYKKIRELKRNFARSAVENESKAILARTDELPSWVFFPDVERAEWLNKMIKQMWPFIDEYVKNLLKNTVEPQVQNSLPKSLQPFKFETINLGEIPPRIGGVKVYIEHVRRDEIYMDMELFYASDSDIKVAVRGFSAGIKDLQIHGTLRIVMKPLVTTMPIIGGMNIFFLNAPAIDFDLTNTANILDMPLLSNTLRSVIEDQIAYYMVLPNKIPIQLAQNIDPTRLRYPMPQGVLRLHVVAGRELKRADMKLIGKGKSDPYCKIYVGAQTYKTKVISDTINPRWDQYFEIPILKPEEKEDTKEAKGETDSKFKAVVDQKHGQYVEIECLDEDPGEDDELGVASIDIQEIAKSQRLDSWLPLENVSTGMIHLRAIWLHLSKDPEDLDKEKDKRRIVRSVSGYGAYNTSKDPEKMRIHNEEHLSSALLLVHLDSAKGLPRSKKSMTEPSAFAKISVGNDSKNSMTKPKTSSPKWAENFQFLVHNPLMQDVTIEICDSKKDDRKIGAMSYSLKDMFAAKDMTVEQPFVLAQSAPGAKLTVRFCMRVLTTNTPADWAMDEPLVVDPEPMQGPELPEEPQTPSTPSASTEPSTPASSEPTPSKAKPATPVKKQPTPKSADTTNNAGDQDEGLVFSASSPETESSAGGDASPDNQGLRHRGIPREVSTLSTSSDLGFGSIQLTVRYSQQRSCLIVVVHKCQGLVALDDNNLSDPYVRLYLLPDKSSSSKKKTQVVKDNLNPTFDETFEWNVTQTEAATRTVSISVKNQVGVFSKNKQHMGECNLDLKNMPDLSKATTEWFYLEEPNKYKDD